ncbi:MAG: tetratricopeptide repeat protein [Merismopedia sp. SIO2A8]|nr:tetratricopeptide repeat protein [Merismopedia sp. SIO2A8]
MDDASSCMASVSPASSTDDRARADIAYQDGLNAHHLGHLSDAIVFYQQALELGFDSPALHFNLGSAWDQQGQWGKACQYYNQAIALDPQYFLAHENLACVYLKQGQVQQAIQMFQEAIAHHPNQASLFNNLGQAFETQKQYNKAIEAYERAIQLQPDLATTHLNLGYLWWTQSHYDRAIARFHQLLTYAPNYLSAHSACAQIHFYQENFAPAIQHWQRIAKLQSHLLRPYCEHICNWIESIPADKRDLWQHVRYCCAQFLQTLLNCGSDAETLSWLYQTYEHLGLLLMKQNGGVHLAEQYFSHALRITPNPALFVRLGDCFFAQQRWDAAIAL